MAFRYDQAPVHLEYNTPWGRVAGDEHVSTKSTDDFSLSNTVVAEYATSRIVDPANTRLTWAR